MTTEGSWSTGFIESLQRDVQPDVERSREFSFSGKTIDVAVGLPASYCKRRRSYPLLVLLNGEKYERGAIDIARLMADAGEVKECIVLSVVIAEHDLAAALGNAASKGDGDFLRFVELALLPWCLQRYRVKPDNFALFGHGVAGALVLQAYQQGLSGIADFVVVSPALSLIPEVARELSDAGAGRADGNRIERRLRLAMGSLERQCKRSRESGASQTSWLYQQVSSGCGRQLDIDYRELAGANFSSSAMAMLSHFLLHDWSSGKVYGVQAPFLAKPWVNRLAALTRPLARKVSGWGCVNEAQATGAIVYCASLEREFELTVSLPASAVESGRRYPMLLVLDGNYAFHLAAEAAREFSSAGVSDEMIVVGLGVPRREGALAFALRRLQEFAPPAPEYTFSDPLGRILSSLFSVAGLDIRDYPPSADTYYRFIVEEVLPALTAALPIDGDQLALFGHSAGGTFTAFALEQADSPFSCYAMSSPGLGISDSVLLKPSNFVGCGKRRVKALVSIGSEEYENYFNRAAGIHKSEDFARRLQSSGRVECKFMELNLETHSSVVPRALQQAMMYFFPANAIPSGGRGASSDVPVASVGLPL